MKVKYLNREIKSSNRTVILNGAAFTVVKRKGQDYFIKTNS